MESNSLGPPSEPVDGWQMVIDVWTFLNFVFDAAEPVFEHHGLHQKSLVLLALLDKTGSPMELAHLLRSPASSLSSMLKEMEGKGLISRRLHPDDRRRHVLERTELGDQALADGIQAIRRCVAERVNAAPESQRAALGEAMVMLRRAADIPE